MDRGLFSKRALFPLANALQRSVLIFKCLLQQLQTISPVMFFSLIISQCRSLKRSRGFSYRYEGLPFLNNLTCLLSRVILVRKKKKDLINLSVSLSEFFPRSSNSLLLQLWICNDNVTVDLHYFLRYLTVTFTDDA